MCVSCVKMSSLLFFRSTVFRLHATLDVLHADDHFKRHGCPLYSQMSLKNPLIELIVSFKRCNRCFRCVWPTKNWFESIPHKAGRGVEIFTNSRLSVCLVLLVCNFTRPPLSRWFNIVFHGYWRLGRRSGVVKIVNFVSVWGVMTESVSNAI